MPFTDPYDPGTTSSSGPGITSSDLELRLTPQGTMGPNRFGDVVGELSSGGDSKSPLDFAFSAPLRGIGMVGQAIGAVLKGAADITGMLPPVDYISDLRIGDKTVGDAVGAIGGAGINLISQPGKFTADNLPGVGAKARIQNRSDLPSDVQAMINAGATEQEILDYMYKNNKSYSNDPTINLGASILLDPLNLTPAIVGKLNLAKAGTRAAAVGAGVAAGSVAGPVGGIIGGVAGYAAGGKIASKFTGALAGAGVGLDMGNKVKLLQAYEAAGKAAEAPNWLNKYKLFSEFEKGTFGKVRGVSAGIKRGLAYTLAQSTAKAFGDEGLVSYGKAAERISGVKGRGTAVARIGLALQNQLVSAVKDSRFNNLQQKADAIVELIDTDIKVAIAEYRQRSIDGTSTDYVIKKLTDSARSKGKTLEEVYTLSVEEIKGYLQDTSKVNGSRIIDPKTRFEIIGNDNIVTLAKKRLALRLAERSAKAEFGPTYNPTNEAVQNWKLSQDLTQGKMVDSIEASVTAEANILRLGGRAATGRVIEAARSLAQNFERSGADDLARTTGVVEPSATSVAVVLEEIFGGARLGVDGVISGGRYFDSAGNLTKSLPLLRELASRLAMSRSGTYGYNVNRVGNIKRIFSLAQTLAAGGIRNSAAYVEEIGKLLGKKLSTSAREAYKAIDEVDQGIASRITIVRNDSLIAGKVSEWVQLYDRFNEIIAGTLDPAAFQNIPQPILASLFEILKNAPDVATGVSNAKSFWAKSAAREFADIADQVSGADMARGFISSDEVYGMLKSAMDNGATVSAASAKELAGIRSVWTAIGGSVGEFDDLVRSLEADGYKIGLGPEGKMIKTPVVVGRLKQGENAIPEISSQSRPFLDITSDFVDGLPDLAKPGSYKAGRTRSAIQSLMAPIAQTTIGNAAQQRLVLALGDRFSLDEVTEFYKKTAEFAVERRIGMRGLDPQDYNMIMDNVLKEKGISLDIRNRDLQRLGMKVVNLQNEMSRAIAGEFKQVGYSQAFTGKAKNVPMLGRYIAKVSENYYPTLKYKYSPLFFAQELIESPFFAELRGIDKVAVEKKLSEAGYTAQELRAAWGERSSSLAQQIHDQAFYTTMVGSRNGVPSTLKEGVKLRDIFFEGKMDAVDAAKGSRGALDQLAEPKWTKSAEFKESYRDVMAVADMAPRFQEWVRTSRPGEFIALTEKYGTNSLDQLIGWYSEYKRMQSFKFGGGAIDSLKKPGFGFAVNPSIDGLNDVINTAYGIEKAYTPEAFQQLLGEGVRPEVVVSVLRAKIVNVAKDSGFDVTRLNDALNRLEVQSGYFAREFKNPSLYYDEAKSGYQSALTDFVSESKALSTQYALSEVNKSIVMELMENFNPGLGSAADGAKMIEALGNARQYGAEFNTLADLIEQIRVRSGAKDVTPATRAQIKAVVANIVKGDSSLSSTARSTQQILSRSADLLLESHAGEEAAFQAVKYSYQTAADAMDKVNYFNKNRGWLERGLNHQFLGLYPLSYMYGKVLPELARFMFYKPFGKVAPGAGYVAYQKMKDYFDRNQPNAEYQNYAEQPEYLFLLAQLIPGLPDDITVVIPSWLRSGISTVSRQGYDQYNATDLVDELGKPFLNTGVLGTGKMLLNSINELTTPTQIQNKLVPGDRPTVEFRR